MKDVNKDNCSNLKKFISINDLKEMDFNDEPLTTLQRNALKNFDRYRITVLNSQTSESSFHKKYMQLQVMANLTPFEEFLKETYYI